VVDFLSLASNLRQIYPVHGVDQIQQVFLLIQCYTFVIEV